MSKPVFQDDGRSDFRSCEVSALKAMISCWAKWENAKDDYAYLRNMYVEGLTGDAEIGTALDKAGEDARVKKAIKDTTYWRNETMAYAAIVQALRV